MLGASCHCAGHPGFDVSSILTALAGLFVDLAAVEAQGVPADSQVILAAVIVLGALIWCQVSPSVSTSTLPWRQRRRSQAVDRFDLYVPGSARMAAVAVLPEAVFQRAVVEQIVDLRSALNFCQVVGTNSSAAGWAGDGLGSVLILRCPGGNSAFRAGRGQFLGNSSVRPFNGFDPPVIGML
jgi:hypothetical protein